MVGDAPATDPSGNLARRARSSRRSYALVFAFGLPSDGGAVRERLLMRGSPLALAIFVIFEGSSSTSVPHSVTHLPKSPK
jgi:hypothetical protein